MWCASRQLPRLLNGDNGMGHLVMKRAAEIAIEKARSTGIAWVNSQFSNHAGPASLYATMPLAHDMIGLYFAVGNANHLPPWGGLDMLLSTNPIAAAIPAGDEKPIVLDMATTVAAYGKVKTKALRGETMPEGWMIDREGKPLTDPKRADEGMLLPLGGMEAGYKGYGLAMIIGLLAGTLGGAAMGREVIDFNHDDDSVTNTGQAIAAINIAAFGDVAVFKASVDALVRDFRGSQPDARRRPDLRSRRAQPGNAGGPDARWHSDRAGADARAGPGRQRPRNCKARVAGRISGRALRRQRAGKLRIGLGELRRYASAQQRQRIGVGFGRGRDIGRFIIVESGIGPHVGGGHAAMHAPQPEAFCASCRNRTARGPSAAHKARHCGRCLRSRRAR